MNIKILFANLEAKKDFPEPGSPVTQISRLFGIELADMPIVALIIL